MARPRVFLAAALAVATLAGFVVLRNGSDAPVRLYFSRYADLSDLEQLEGATLTGDVHIVAVGDTRWSIQPTFALDRAALRSPTTLSVDRLSIGMPMDTFHVRNGRHVLEVELPVSVNSAERSRWTGRASFSVANDPRARRRRSSLSQQLRSAKTPPAVNRTKGHLVERRSRSLSSRNISNIPLSIAANCSRDVTTALNSVIASFPNGTGRLPSILRFGRKACYRINEKLIVRDRHDLVFDGNGATFKAAGKGNGDRKQWQVYGGRNITFKNMTVLGVNTSVQDGAYNKQTEWQHNFDFWGTQGVLLDAVVGKYAFGDFVAFEADYRTCCAAADFPPVRNAVIKNSRFFGAGRMGISTNYVDGLRIENNTIDRVRWSTIDIEVEDPAWYARNIVIRNNIIGDVWHSFVANSGYDAPTENVTISGNVMTKLPGTNQPPIHIIGGSKLRRNWMISGNVFLTRTWFVWMKNATGIHIRKNTGRMSSNGYAAVHVQTSDVGDIEANSFLNATAAAEFDGSSSEWIVCGNRLKVAGGYTQPKAC